MERRGLPFGPRLSLLRALLSQSAASLTASDALPDECTFYIELGSGTPLLRVLGEEDSLELDAETLGVLKDTIDDGTVDLVLSDGASIDLTFEVPPGPLPEVSRMIDAEILYRSPFAETATLAIWEAHEAPNGGWQVTAILTLEEPVMTLKAQLEQAQIDIASIIREIGDREMRVLPPWKAAVRDSSPSPLSIFRSLAPALQALLAGAALFALSATLHWGQTVLQDWSLQDEAARAQTKLRQTAAASARLRGLDMSLSMSTEVLALTGTLSEALPDAVWLDQVIIDGVDVTLVGFAPSAAEVTRILTDLPALRDIRFASPVIRDNSQSIERFRIAATLGDGVAR